MQRIFRKAENDIKNKNRNHPITVEEREVKSFKKENFKEEEALLTEKQLRERKKN